MIDNFSNDGSRRAKSGSPRYCYTANPPVLAGKFEGHRRTLLQMWSSVCFHYLIPQRLRMKVMTGLTAKAIPGESEVEESENLEIVSNTNGEKDITTMDDTTWPQTHKAAGTILKVQHLTTTAESEEQIMKMSFALMDASYCRQCPAVDCTNGPPSGRCGFLGGQFHCPRHNS